MQLTRKGVIGSLDVHQNLATQVLNEDRVKKGLADIVYQLISKGLQSELRV
jgi:type I restriction enzyme R subunit